ncbi:MAG TPA: tetratricopeptide repeat protein [Candidatus Limnocylindrales bacterium]|nr:tetratricopeptide repeat protein [Candidatus Limnocylindrales bacterium]
MGEVPDAAANALPSGTVSLLFTDIDGSTRLLEQLGDAYATLLSDHHRLISEAIARHGGSHVDAAGDGLFVSFQTARAALLACIDAQRAIGSHQWPQGADVRVRMGLHTGEPMSAVSGYVGIDVHRAARICAAGHGGQVLISEAARGLIGAGVPDDVSFRDLGEHRLKDLATPVRLYQVVAPELASEFPPVRSLETLPNNLPHQLSSFVGRAQEIADAQARLATTSILTLTGPGGVGKTRLALEVGAHLVDAYPGGVWYIELAALNDGALIGDTIASALQLKQAAAGAIPTLLSALADRRVLLILDNCEHMLDPVVEVADQLLRRCPDLRIVATSREALGMSGESLMPVPSMSLPEPGGPGSPEAFERLASCDAVQLFIDRGRAVAPGFALTEENAEAIAQICLRLDGIPLAVELAAARVRSLPPHQIAARLDNRFRLLTGGSRTALPRHRTLRAAMDWSFDMLGEAEQALLPRLSAFAGSFSIEAAEAVAAGDPVDRDEVIDLLARLVDKSLLMPEEGSTEARYRMLETIRDYAQEHLAESGNASEVYARHRDWFVALVQQARPGFFDGPEQAAWLARLSDDHDNLRAALRWSDEDPDGASAELSLASGLWRFWEIRGHLAEGSAWLDRALARTGGEISARRALGLTGVGVLATQRGDHAAASAAHEASLLLHRELGNPMAVAAACSNVASAAIEQGNFDRARELYREAVGLSRSAGDLQGAAFSLLNLADLTARQGDDVEADDLYAQSIQTFETNGDLWGMAHATSRLALVSKRRGDLAAARSRYQDAMALYRRIGDRRAEARMLAGLGDVSSEEGDVPGAAASYRESLTLRSQLGDRAGIAAMFERLAGIAEADPERAARLLGMAGGLREAIGAPLSTAATAELDQFVTGLTRKVGADAFEGAMAEGRRASLRAAIAYASKD